MRGVDEDVVESAGGVVGVIGESIIIVPTWCCVVFLLVN